MMTHTSRWLALALVSCAACTYSFPDPKDASQVYKCVGPDDCADGFSCVDQVCLEDAKFGTELVTVVGHVRAPAQLVSTSVQDLELTVPVINGAYELQVPVGDGSQIVAVYSRGSAADGREAVRLGSVLGDTARLKQLADTAGKVTADVLGAVDLTPFTTAELGAVCATAGGSVPVTRAALVGAEQNLAQSYTEQQLLDAAAALRIVVEDPTKLPAGTTTADLACDPAAMRGLVAQIRGSSVPPDDPVTTTAAAMLTDAAVGPGFRAASLPPSYFSALKSRHELIGANDERIVLGAGGVGAFQWPLQRTELPLVSTTVWRIQPDGALMVTLDSPDTGLTELMSADEIASYYSDATTRDAITATLGGGRYEVPFALDSVEVWRLAEGTGADWVVSTTRRTLRFAQALAPYGLVVSDVPVADPPAPRFFHRSDAVEYLPWPSGLAGTTWATELVLTPDRPYALGFNPTGLHPTAALVAFRGDGSATVYGGVIPSGSSLTFTWTQASDGVVTLTYPDRVQRQRMVLWDSEPGAEGMLTWNELGLPSDVLAYGAARQLDTTQITPSSFTTAPGEYWQTEINTSGYGPEVGDEVPREAWFGFELRSDGSATQRRMDTEPSPGAWVENPFTWYMDGSAIVIETHVDQYGFYSSCAVGPANPSCFVWIRRRWEPVSISADGKRLNVIESDVRVFEAEDLIWNSALSGWQFSDGTPFDPATALQYYFLPRVGTHSRMPIQP